jgi:hypothetical protein
MGTVLVGIKANEACINSWKKKNKEIWQRNELTWRLGNIYYEKKSEHSLI